MDLRRTADTRVVEHLLATVPGDIEAFRGACSLIQDWRRILDAAREQAVLGVLLHYLNDANVHLPAADFREAQRHCIIEQMWASQVNAALGEILPQLDARGIKTVALKGPVLAQRLYPDPAVRPCIDVDLLVDAGQFDAAHGVLAALGYHGQTGPGAAYALAHEHHLHFSRPNTPVVELHFRLYVGFGTVLEARDALERATAIRTAGGTPAWVLAPEDEIVYLALHATGHSYVRLLWLYDLKLMVRRFPDLDWRLVAERARGAGVLRAVAFAGELLRERLAVPVPTDLGASRSMRGRLARHLLPTVMRPTERSARENLESLIFTCLLCDRWSAGFRLLRHHTARALRRRVHRAVPWVVPEQWSA